MCSAVALPAIENLKRATVCAKPKIENQGKQNPTKHNVETAEASIQITQQRLLQILPPQFTVVNHYSSSFQFRTTFIFYHSQPL